MENLDKDNKEEKCKMMNLFASQRLVPYGEVTEKCVLLLGFVSFVKSGLTVCVQVYLFCT